MHGISNDLQNSYNSTVPVHKKWAGYLLVMVILKLEIRLMFTKKL